MDTVTTIVAALAAGALAAGQDVAAQAVKDGYTAFKALVVRKFGGQAELAPAVEGVEQKPDSPARQAVLKEELETAGAGQDAQVVAQAQALLDLLKEHGLVSGPSYRAELHGSGAIAQGQGSVAAGAGGVAVGGDVSGAVVAGRGVQGDQVGGDKIQAGNITGSSGIAMGRGAQATVTRGLSGQDVERLFLPVMQVVRQSPPEKQAQAAQMVEDLKNEAAKGTAADDARMAKLLDGLVDLVPGAVGAVVSVFATPILGGMAGPVTKFVLNKIQGK